MANAANSVLLAGQVQFNERMLGAEWKLPDCAAVKAAGLAEMANPSLREIRTSESRTMTAKFPIRQAQTGGVVRVASHTGNNPDTDTETITWSKFVEDFSIGFSLADNNVFEWAQLYAAARRNAVYNLINRVDASFAASLLTDESTANAGGANGTFNAATDEFEIDALYADNFYGEVAAMLRQNNYRGQLVGIVDAKAGTLADRLGRDGAGNAVNTSAQLIPYSAIVPTTRTLAASVHDGSGLFYQNGLVGVNFWTPPKNRGTINFAQASFDSIGQFGQFMVPEFPGVEFAHSIYAARSDQSAAGGDEQDILIHEEVSLEMAYVSAPVSTFHTETSPVFTAILLT